jgi:hypothetical protein
MDNSMNCSAIMAEVASNNAKITELGGQKGAKVAQNVAAGVVGLVVWPVWFLMDFQGAAGTEIKALQDRNAYLATKANEEDCGRERTTTTATAAPSAPAPATPYPAAPPAAYAPAPTTPVYYAPIPTAPAPVHAAPAPTYATPVAATAPTATTYAPVALQGQSPPVQARSYAPPTHGTFDPYAIDPYPAEPTTAADEPPPYVAPATM